MASEVVNKKLSWKRFIPMILLMGIGGTLICTGAANANIFKYGIYVFDFDFRTEIIYFLSFIVGVFHYLNITKDKQESKNIFVKTSYGFVDSIGSAIGYALVIDKGMNVASGLLKEVYGIKSFFNDPSSVDYFSIGFIVSAVIVVGTVRLYQMGKESVFEITHSFKDVKEVKKES